MKARVQQKVIISEDCTGTTQGAALTIEDCLWNENVPEKLATIEHINGLQAYCERWLRAVDLHLNTSRA